MTQPMRSELGKVRGLGSAHHGTHHWWMQRITAIALLPLTIWFIFTSLSIASSNSAGQSAVVAATEIMSNPLNAFLAGLFVVCVFHHLQLGLQVVIEDYIPNTAMKFTSLIAMKFASFTVAGACIYALLLITFR